MLIYYYIRNKSNAYRSAGNSIIFIPIFISMIFNFKFLEVASHEQCISIHLKSIGNCNYDTGRQDQVKTYTKTICIQVLWPFRHPLCSKHLSSFGTNILLTHHFDQVRKPNATRRVVINGSMLTFYMFIFIAPILSSSLQKSIILKKKSSCFLILLNTCWLVGVVSKLH